MSEIDPSSIPDEYWPRCDWCGGFLGDDSVEVKSILMHDRRRICTACHYTLRILIQEVAPIAVGYSLAKHCDVDHEDVRHLGADAITTMAEENMKKALES